MTNDYRNHPLYLQATTITPEYDETLSEEEQDEASFQQQFMGDWIDLVREEGKWRTSFDEMDTPTIVVSYDGSDDLGSFTEFTYNHRSQDWSINGDSVYFAEWFRSCPTIFLTDILNCPLEILSKFSENKAKYGHKTEEVLDESVMRETERVTTPYGTMVITQNPCAEDFYDISLVDSEDKILANIQVQEESDGTLFVEWLNSNKKGCGHKLLQSVVKYFKSALKISGSIANKQAFRCFVKGFGEPIDYDIEKFNSLGDTIDDYDENGNIEHTFTWKLRDSVKTPDIEDIKDIWKSKPNEFNKKEEYMNLSDLIPTESVWDNNKITDMGKSIEEDSSDWDNISALKYNGKYYVMDGHHRLQAYKNKKISSEYVNVYTLKSMNESFEEPINDEILDEDLMVFPEELNQKLFDGEELKPEVRDKLIEIGMAFYEEFDLQFDLLDLYFEGSMAQYNWVEMENINGIQGLNYKSDIDLHLVLDYSKLPMSREVVEDYFKSKKTVFNEHHNIEVMGFEVELGNEDINTPLTTSGVYSLFRDEWIKKPEPITQEVEDIRTTPDYEEFRNYTIETIKSNNPERIKDLWNKIKYMRRTSLKLDGEFGKGNLIFKALRQESLLGILKGKVNELEDKALSLTESLKDYISVENKKEGFYEYYKEYPECWRIHNPEEPRISDEYISCPELWWCNPDFDTNLYYKIIPNLWYYDINLEELDRDINSYLNNMTFNLQMQYGWKRDSLYEDFPIFEIANIINGNRSLFEEFQKNIKEFIQEWFEYEGKSSRIMDTEEVLDENASATCAGNIASLNVPIGIGSKFRAKKGDWKKSAEQLNKQIISKTGK